MLALFAVFFLISVVSGTSRHKHRQSQSTNLNVAPISGKFDSVSTGQYSLLNNLWGEQDANPGGSQTSQLISISGNVIGWETSWAWSGGPYQVKSYANIQLDVGINQQLSAISSMPVSWVMLKPQTGN
jgi:xyloglucan-specific endo-beta-1,4-glucanase